MGTTEKPKVPVSPYLLRIQPAHRLTPLLSPPHFPLAFSASSLHWVYLVFTADPPPPASGGDCSHRGQQPRLPSKRQLTLTLPPQHCSPSWKPSSLVLLTLKKIPEKGISHPISPSFIGHPSFTPAPELTLSTPYQGLHMVPPMCS